MNFIFYYILASWKDYIYNNWILKNRLFNIDFSILDEKYYLINARYYNMNYFLCFYHEIYYYLKK